MADTIHRFTINGEPWVCAANDHGPFCRLCQRVDGTTAVLLAMADEGLIDIVGNSGTGELRYRLTDEGQAAAEELVATNPDAKALHDEVLSGILTREAEKN